MGRVGGGPINAGGPQNGHGFNGGSVYSLMTFPRDRDGNAVYELEQEDEDSFTLPGEKGVPMNRPSAGSQHYNENYFQWQKSAAEFGGWANLTKFERYVRPDFNVIDFGCGA